MHRFFDCRNDAATQRRFFMGRHRSGRGFRGFGPGESDMGGRGGFGGGHFPTGRKLGSADLQLLLLLLLEAAPSHGYELIKVLEDRSGGFYSPSPGMIYPALTYLEELGYTTATMDGTKKQYHITAAGQAHLAQHRSEAEAMLGQLERLSHRMRRMRRAFEGEASAGESDAAAAAPAAAAAAATVADRGAGPVLDARVNQVLARLRVEAARHRPNDGGPRGSGDRDPQRYAEFGFSIHPEQGELIYLLCRALRATRVAEFATSVGVSTLYFAAAVRDNGGGTVIGSELVPEKVAAARANLQQAGLADYVELREGDARETLRDLGGPVDFVLIDGWPTGDEPSLARQVFEIVAPQIRSGGMVMNDNAEPDYLAYVRNPANGFVSMTLPLKGGTELSLKL
jgi:predicted O-methyltransferase YrrM/DNA-binding PadR family transcriptional regulator